LVGVATRGAGGATQHGVAQPVKTTTEKMLLSNSAAREGKSRAGFFMMVRLFLVWNNTFDYRQKIDKL
jgi:hypothetical protein